MSRQAHEQAIKEFRQSSALALCRRAGISNERGQWVVPAFQLHLSKLDVMQPPRPLAAMAPMGFPRVAPAPSPPPHGISQPTSAAAHRSAAPATAAAPAAAAGNGSPGRSGLASVAGAQAASQAAGAACAGVQGAGQDMNAACAEAGGGCRTAWFDTLVLDCDGVLVDSERASCEALRRSILEVRVECGGGLCMCLLTCV